MARLTFNTFPRSGTMWVFQTLKIAFPKNDIIFGDHRITTLRKEANVITSVRNPKDCVPSYLVFFNKDNPNRALEWYCRFMQGTIDSKDRIFVADFRDIISKPQEVMQSYSSRFNLDSPDPFTLESIRSNVLNNFPNHLPRPITEARIKANETVLSNPLLSDALFLYEEVLQIN